MITGLEITFKGKTFIEQNDGPKARRFAPVHIQEQLSILKAVDDPEDILRLDINKLPPRGTQALDRLVSLGYIVRTN